MGNMTSSRDVIIQLKEVWREKKATGMQQSDILRQILQNGDNLSKSSISRVFADGSEDNPDKFSYENTLRPIAKALLDIETIEDTDDKDTQAYKTILKYKIGRIDELDSKNDKLESELYKEKIKYQQKIEKELEKLQKQYDKKIEFLKHQITLKDKRIDQLLEAGFIKDQKNDELLARLLKCQRCSNAEKED